MILNHLKAVVDNLIRNSPDSGEKDVIAQTVDKVTFDTVVKVELNEDNVAIFVDRYDSPPCPKCGHSWLNHSQPLPKDSKCGFVMGCNYGVFDRNGPCCCQVVKP